MATSKSSPRSVALGLLEEDVDSTNGMPLRPSGFAMTDFLGAPWWAWFIIFFELQVYAFTGLMVWTFWGDIWPSFKAKLLRKTNGVEAPRVE
jgi:hypothetical protein